MLTEPPTFEGVYPVLQLPFGRKPDQPIMHGALATLACHMLELGADGVAVLGLASEASTLTQRERDEACATTVSALGSRIPVVVGIDGATAVATARARRAAALGAKALMVLPAPGRQPHDQPRHYARVADASGLPVLIQDSPQVTGVTLSDNALITIAGAHPLLKAVKVEAPESGAKVSTIVASGIEAIGGWGGLHYLEFLRRGASGCMPGCDLGPAMKRIHTLAVAGADDEAEHLYSTVLPLLSYASQSLELLILAAKRLLVRKGIFVRGDLRRSSRTLDVYESQTLDLLHARLMGAGVVGFASQG